MFVAKIALVDVLIVDAWIFLEFDPLWKFEHRGVAVRLFGCLCNLRNIPTKAYVCGLCCPKCSRRAFLDLLLVLD